MIRFALIFLLLLISACSTGVYRQNAPKNLLSKEKMISILTELTLIESAVEMNYAHQPDYLKTIKNSGKLIIKKYHVSEKDFEANMNYYASNQEQMKEIYTAVLDSLNLMSGQISSEK